MKTNKFFIFSCFISLLMLFAACSGSGPNGPIVDSDEYAYLQKKSPKRGVSFSWQLDAEFDVLGSAVSWSYNWSNTYPSSQEGKYNQYGITYMPMCWNATYSATDIKKYFDSQTDNKYLLGFNEPNLVGQANMTPTQAAGHWADVVSLAQESGAKLISPALNWGTLSGYSDGVYWLDKFFEQVDINQIHAIGVHIYMGSAKTMLSDLQRYKKFGKPLWLTEFCGWDGISSSVGQCTFMTQSINALEQDDQVERYAWFIPKWMTSTEASPYQQLITKSNPPALTERGFIFVNMSTFDKSVVYPCGKRIPAEHYYACSVSETYSSVDVIRTTDIDGILQLEGLSTSQSVDYQMALSSSATKFQLRYTATRQSALDVLTVDANGAETLLTTVDCPTTGDKASWVTIESPINVDGGTKIVRLRPSKGLLRINWFKIK